jgi:valyl-tRNA synthetase
MTENLKTYNPKDCEDKWYEIWSGKGFFGPEINPDGPPYCIVIPPPNVTGSLHMGHALNATLQDILIRWKRMSGYRALWLPGTDHAGIATQNVVERQLMKEGSDRHTMGRDEFIRRVWQWKAEYGERIIYQLKKLGASADWSRQRFTLDEGLSKAVRLVFVGLYEEGLIYRATRLINWCPRCRTALSDIEVEHEEIEGTLTYIKYPFSDGKGHITVATTRPETMLGDTAVAVNPDDERYRGVIGRNIELPLTGRIIPVIGDSAVDPAFGTGAVKVTPAHDFNDEAMAKRQHPPLRFISVIGDDAKMTEHAGRKYAGIDRHECRKLVVGNLKAQGLIEKEERHKHAIGHCYRCKTVIEPFLTPQWYVKVGPLAEEAVKAVREKRIRIIPEGWENSYFSWMDGIKDWCISRQIWWGHRIPVWYCDACKKTIVQEEEPKACPACGGEKPIQDQDVLDTWFSSALWPFSTLGWPERTEDLKVFYPTSVLVTAFDILFFWVARMIMMGLKFMGDAPFKDVYIHAIIRDEEGQKMSKSKGNVIDPLAIIDKHGADAFRFTLAAFAAQGRDIKFSEERVKGYRHFINKLWNASKFMTMNIEEDEAKDLKDAAFDIPSRWIASRLAQTAQEVDCALSEYRFNDAAGRIYQFVWHELCDWYIEMAKTGMENPDTEKGVKLTLLKCIEASLRLLHPFMPFVTEEIWQAIGGYGLKKTESIMIAPYPSGLKTDPEADSEMNYIMEAVTSVRSIRGELNISPSLELQVYIKTMSASVEKILGENMAYIKRLCRSKDVYLGAGIKKPVGSATSVKEQFEVYVPIKGILDIDAEISRLGKEIEKIDKSVFSLSRKLMNEDFLKRAPSDVVTKEKQKYEELVKMQEKLEEGMKKMKQLK